MARVTNLGINIFSHWNGRGMRRARRSLNQLGDGMNDLGKDAKRLSRATNRLDASNKMLARSLKKPRRALRGMGDDFRGVNHDANRFRRTMRVIGRVLVSPFRGINRVRHALRGLGDEFIVSAKRTRNLNFAFRSLGKRLLLVLAPALLPIINHIAGIVVELGAMATAATIGFGGFSALALAASRRALDLADKNKKLTKSQREHVNAVNGLRKAWNNFLDSRVGGRLLVPMNIAIRAITRNMDKLKPLVNAIAPIFKDIARRFADWMDRSNGFQRFVNHMREHGVPIMRNLAAAARSVLKFLGRVFRDSLPGARKLSRAIRRGARALANWAAEGGFKRWLNRTKKDGPKVRKFFRELRKLMPKLLEAIRKMAPVSLKLATAFLKIANNLSPGQIRALMWAFILARPALLAFRLASAGVHGALWLLRKRAKRAGTAVAGAGGKAKKAKGKFQGLKNTLKNLGRVALGGATAIFFAPKSLGRAIGRVVGKLGGPKGLLRLLGRLGVIAGAVSLALWVDSKTFNFLGTKIREVKNGMKILIDVMGNLANVAGDVAGAFGKGAGGLASGISSAVDELNPFDSSGDDAVNTTNRLKKGANRAAKATKNYSNKLKDGTKKTKGFGMSAKEARKKFSGFSNGLDKSRAAAANFSKGTKKPKDALGRLSRQTGFSRKELKKMGISSGEAEKQLKKFGTGAVKSSNQVKNKAGGAFKNGAKNLKRNWGGATLFVRRTTRKRLLATIHQTRAFRNKLGNLFGKIRKDIRKKWGKTFDGLAKTAKRKFNAAEKQAKQFRRTVGRQFDRTRKHIRKVWGKATDLIRDLARKRFNKAEKQANQFRKTINKQFNRTRGHIKKVWGKATSMVVNEAKKKFKKAANHANNFRKGINKAFERIRKNVRKSWNDTLDGIKNRARRRFREIRQAVDGALNKIRKSFSRATDAIKKIWKGRLPDIFKDPIKFFINKVYNGGLRKAWNKTFANLPGIKEMEKAPGFAKGGLAQRGGRVRGAGGPTSDKIDARLSAGEYVVRAKAVKQIGVDVLNRINQGVGGDLPKRGVPMRDDYVRKSVADSHFAMGGMIGSRQRHNHCSYYTPKFAEGGFISVPSTDMGEVVKNAIAAGVKAAKKSKMLGNTAQIGFSSSRANMSNSDEPGFDWGTNLYQDVAKNVGRKVINPFINLGFRAANKGSLRAAGEWAEVPPTKLKGTLDALLQYIWENANTGCGTGGFAPFRPWRAGDGQRVSFRGVTLDKRTRAMCQASEQKLGKRMSYFQGSWSHASASAGTHAGGGAVDTGPASFRTSGAMRASGFAAWARGSKFGSGSFSPHVHGIAIGNKNLSGAAKAQVRAFHAGRDGLAGNRPDNQPGGAVGSCAVAGGGCGVQRWAPLAQTALRMGGCPAGPNNLRKFLRLMKQESCGNPNAVNNWDSNARAGNASQGLMQVIPTTFRANHVRGTSNNIRDPLANMAAAARYIRRRYGCNIPQAPYAQGGFVMRRNAHGDRRMPFCGGGEVIKQAMPWIFDNGGTLRPGLNLVNNKTGGPERLKRDRGGHDECVHVHIHGNVYTKSEREFEGMVVAAVHNAQRKGRVKTR